jgi:hypothetical protein
MRARLKSLKLPVFYQIGPEDLEDAALVDTLYRAGNQKASRVVEAHVMGHGVLQFYNDPSIAARVVRWINDVMPARNGRPAARPTPPRSG